MKENRVFFNPFRIISPKLNAEASRLEEPPPPEMTCLEEGLLVMTRNLIEMSQLISKTLILGDQAKCDRCAALAAEVHNEEKGLTGDLVCNPTVTTGEVLRTLVLFPGRLERCGDLLESILNCSRIKNRDGIPFSDLAQAELERLFGTLGDLLKNLKDLLATNNKTLLDLCIAQSKALAEMTMDFALSHEERLVTGLCSPKASSLYLDILDSVRNIARHVREMCENLQRISAQYEAQATG